MKLCTLLVSSLIFLTGNNENFVTGAKILGLLPTPSPSHHIWNRALMLALAARGHQVTVLSPDPEKQKVPNHTDIVIEEAYESIDHTQFNYEEMGTKSYFENSIVWFDWGQEACEHGITSKGAKQLRDLRGKENFDLIIIDLTLEECFLAFVPYFDSPPVIAITAYASPPWHSDIVGNPQILSFTNSYILPYSDHMTFSQRTFNFMLHLYVSFHRNFRHLPAMDNIVRKHFGDSSPVPSEIEKNISLVMVNTHFSFDYPRPLVPAMIQVGGLHTKPAKELPKDIKEFLDNAEHGAIFFSLGSNIRSDKMTEEKIKAYLDAFSELPQRVLWKWESNSLPGQPKNVMVGKWMPQNDILAHPKLRLFISHGGMLSTQEAIYHGVPVVGMPFSADQFQNIKKLFSRGLAVELSYITLTKESILKAVHTILDNPSYRENMKKVSTAFRDQPETPLERAVFWSEYVLRNGGETLRCASADLPWYQYFLLDVIVTLISCLLAVLVLIYLGLRTVCRIIIPQKKDKKSKQQ